ncbi:MAG: pyruvate ferredoxin oxidoreductase [Patescibacteria group bacterium]
MNNKKQILEGSRAIALTVNNIGPDVISAYPITPQTHIVEDLAKIKANGEGNYEYVRAESEFTAASIVLGASATGSRVYSATSSQGLLLMTEVVYNISGLRLPIVMTLVNRAISSPINIWNDQQDAMAIRDAGWIMFFAENNQEAIEQHVLAYKIAEETKIPVFVNIDGFILSHCYEAVEIPSKKDINKFLGKYKAKSGEYLDTKNPVTIGAFMAPNNYQSSRENLNKDFNASIKKINNNYSDWKKTINQKCKKNDNGLFEYTGEKKVNTIVVAMGSVIGTIKSALKNEKNVGILKIKTYRPFPHQEIYDIIKEVGAKNIIVLEKSVSIGSFSPLYSDICALNKKQTIKNFISGLGGKDIKESDIKNIIKKFNSYKNLNFI